MPKASEAKIKAEIAARGGAVKVRTIYPDPNNRNRFARIYVVRKAGERGGHTIRGPIQTAKVQTQATTSRKRGK